MMQMIYASGFLSTVKMSTTSNYVLHVMQQNRLIYRNWSTIQLTCINGILGIYRRRFYPNIGDINKINHLKCANTQCVFGLKCHFNQTYIVVTAEIFIANNHTAVAFVRQVQQFRPKNCRVSIKKSKFAILFQNKTRKKKW